MSEKPNSTIQVTCPCCSAMLTIDPALSVVLNHKLPAKPQLIAELKSAAQFVKEEVTRRDEKYQQNGQYIQVADHPAIAPAGVFLEIHGFHGRGF